MEAVLINLYLLILMGLKEEHSDSPRMKEIELKMAADLDSKSKVPLKGSDC
jgi:hypothetical protein